MSFCAVRIGIQSRSCGTSHQVLHRVQVMVTSDKRGCKANLCSSSDPVMDFLVVCLASVWQPGDQGWKWCPLDAGVTLQWNDWGSRYSESRKLLWRTFTEVSVMQGQARTGLLNLECTGSQLHWMPRMKPVSADWTCRTGTLSTARTESELLFGKDGNF